MADESEELCLFVRLDEKYDFVVVFPKTRIIGELREEVQSVAREAFPAFRGGKVLNVQNKSGSHLPDRYQVGKLLQNKSRIVCYSSDYQKSNEARKEMLGKKKTSNISNSKRTSSRHDSEESSRSSGISDDDRPLFNKRKSWKMQRRRRKNKGIKGSKDNENAKKLSQTDKPSPTEAKEEMVAKIGKSDMQKTATKNQANTSPEHFVVDMREIENESRQGERLMRVCFTGVGKSLGKTQSGACGIEDDLCQSVALNKRSQQMKTSGSVRKKQSAINVAAKHSLREAKGTVNHMHCRSSEVILSASKYKSLFTVPEHCRPKRKEAIETSASKVAEWLSTNDEPSEVDVQDTNSDEGTMDVDSETEEGTSKQVEKDIEAVTDGDEADDVDEDDVAGSHGDDVGSHGDGVGSPGDDADSHGDDVGHHDDVSSHGDDAGSHGVDKDIDNSDISVAESVNSSKQANANNTTTRYQQKDVSTMTDICVSASPSKSKRREGGCIHGALRSSNETTVCGIPGTLLSPWDNKQNCLTKKRALLSSTGMCQVKIEKLPIDIKHGRNIRVEYSYHHQMNERPFHGDDMSNADNNCSAVQTENTLTKDNCLEIQRENENTATRGREIPSVKHKKVVRSSTGKVEKYLGSKDGIDNETARGEEMQQKRDLQTSAEESPGNEQDVHGAVSKENVENCEDVQTRQARQYLHENSTIKNDDDDYYGDNDDVDEDEEMNDNITPDVYKNNTMTVDYGDEDRELSEPGSENVLTVNCRVKDDMELKLPEQSVVTDKRKELETDAECNNNTRRDTCSAVETTESPAQVKQVSAVEKEWRLDDETEGENNDLTPIYLTPIKNGEQVVWLKETSREGDSEQVGNDYEDFMNGLEISDCNTTSYERPRSIREKTPLLSSETAKESEDDEEKSRENVNLRRNGRRKSMKAKKRSERKKRKLEGNEDVLVKHVEQESVSDRRVISKKTVTVEENVEFELVTQEPAETRSEQKKRKLERDEDTLVENINREDDRTTALNITLKENVELECASQDPTEKRSEQKKRKLEENEDTLVENVNKENDRTKASKITLEENMELEIVTQDSTEKRSELKRSKRSKDTLVNGLHQDNVTDKTTTSKKKMEETMEVQFASQEPIEKRFEQIKKRMENDGNALVENVTQECVSNRTEDRKKSVETPLADKHDYSEDEQNDNVKSNDRKTSCQMEVNNMSDHLQEENQVHQSKKKKKKKKEKRRQHELSNTASTLETPPESPSVERVAVKEMNSISGQPLQGNLGNQIEMLKKSKKKKKEKRENSEISNMKSTTGTTTTPPSVERVAVKRKADEGVDLLQNPESEAFIGKKNSKKQVGKDSYCEDKQSKDNEKSIDRETRNQVEGVNDTSGQHREENHVYQVEMLKKSKKKKKEKKRKSELTETTNTSPSVERAALKRKADGRTDLLQKTESEASIGEKPTMKQAGKHSHLEDERDKDDEKSIYRKISNQVNSTCDQLQEGDVVNQSQKRKNKKDKRRKSKLCNTESTTETFAPPILEKVDSPNDSGFSENSRKKFKKNEQGMPEEGFVLNDPKRPTSKGNKKKSKASSSLLDLALDDTADQKDSKTSRKTVSSEGRSNHHLARHFRQTPKGFLNSTKNRKITASTSSIIISRKPSTNWKEIQKQVEMTAKEKDLVTSRVSFEQLLDDESFWNT